MLPYQWNWSLKVSQVVQKDHLKIQYSFGGRDITSSNCKALMVTSVTISPILQFTSNQTSTIKTQTQTLLDSIRHGKTGQNFSDPTRPDPKNTWSDPYFLTRSKNRLTRDPICVFCGPTRPEPELEPFFLNFFFLGKKIVKLR